MICVPVYISFTIANSACRDRRTCIYAPTRRPREEGEVERSPPSFFVLAPEPTHSPFSLISGRQVITANAGNGKLKRVKIRGGASILWRFLNDRVRRTPAPNYASVDREISLDCRFGLERRSTDQRFESRYVMISALFPREALVAIQSQRRRERAF